MDHRPTREDSPAADPSNPAQSLDLSHQHAETPVALDGMEPELTPDLYRWIEELPRFDDLLAEDHAAKFPGIYSWIDPRTKQGLPPVLVISIPVDEVHPSFAPKDLIGPDLDSTALYSGHLDLRIAINEPRSVEQALELAANLLDQVPRNNAWKHSRTEPGGLSQALQEGMTKAATSIVNLEHRAYTTPFKVSQRNGARNARQYAVTGDISAAAMAIRALNPTWSRADHKALAQAHQILAGSCSRHWNTTANGAALLTFGRPFSVLQGDYKVSGIGREEFPENFKNLLRKFAHEGTDHKALALAHDYVARYFRNLPTQSDLSPQEQE